MTVGGQPSWRVTTCDTLREIEGEPLVSLPFARIYGIKHRDWRKWRESRTIHEIQALYSRVGTG